MKVTITGATGFVGTAVVNELLRRRHGIRVLARRPEAAVSRFNHPVEVAAGDILEPAKLAAAFAGAEAVIHLVGIIVENEGHSFDEIHRQGAENVVRAAREASISRYLHMSAMGASPDSPSEYSRTKAGGEEAVKSSGLDWTIFRPSIIFGPGDGFASLLARIIRTAPFFVPVIGPGTTKFMPVSVRDVARLFADALEKPEASRRAFEVGGPEVFTLNEIYREISAALGKPGKRLVHLPLWYGRLLATLMAALPNPPLTRDQLRSLSVDNVGDTGPALAVFGGAFRDFKSGIREYIHPPYRRDPTVGI
jgi:NADH dehydrogenase